MMLTFSIIFHFRVAENSAAEVTLKHLFDANGTGSTKQSWLGSVV